MPLSPLQIKVNALKRLIKEQKLYVEEVEEQEKYVASMVAQKQDEYEIKKQTQVLEESKRMVPEVETKIKQFKEDLAKFVENYSGDENLQEAKALIGQ